MLSFCHPAPRTNHPNKECDWFSKIPALKQENKTVFFEHFIATSTRLFSCQIILIAAWVFRWTRTPWTISPEFLFFIYWPWNNWELPRWNMVNWVCMVRKITEKCKFSPDRLPKRRSWEVRLHLTKNMVETKVVSPALGSLGYYALWRFSEFVV